MKCSFVTWSVTWSEVWFWSVVFIFQLWVRWSCIFRGLHSWNSLFKHFQRYLSIFRNIGIFRNIDVYSHTLTSAQIGRRGEAFPSLFEHRKKCPDFCKKGPDYFHLLVKFSIQNVTLRVSKIQRGFFFWCFWRNLYQSALVPQIDPRLALKKFWLRTCTQALFFLQNTSSQMLHSALNKPLSQ